MNKTIFSLGASVGFSASARWTPGTNEMGYASSDFGDAYEKEDVFAFRLPLGLFAQHMPPQGRFVGWHLGIVFADLGNFLRSRDDIRWKDFLQIGGQAGVLLGNRRHSVVIGLDVSWSPGLYRRDVAIVGQAERVSLEGALNAGWTVAYYVPFFDLN